MKIIVTGGTGFIGSHTAVELIQKDYEVVLVDNLNNSKLGVVQRIESIISSKVNFVHADLAKTDQASKIFNEHEDAQGVLHFAAKKAVGESVKAPLDYYQNNINSMINVLNNMKIHGISNLVFSSSCTVYGEPDKLPVTELTPIKKALSPYGNTKRICEEIIQDSFGLDGSNESFSILRYFNPVGAHDSGLIGEDPNGVPNNLFPFITDVIRRKQEYLKIFGDDYETPDGTAIRDYIHIQDLAEAHVLALERLVKKENNLKDILNLGTGRGSSVLEVVSSFEKSLGREIPKKIFPRRAGDIPAIYADPSLAERVLSWKASRTLDKMTTSSIDWILSDKDLII